MRGSLIKQHSLMVHVALSPSLMIPPFMTAASEVSDLCRQQLYIHSGEQKIKRLNWEYIYVLRERSNAGQLNVRTCFTCFCDVGRKHYMQLKKSSFQLWKHKALSPIKSLFWVESLQLHKSLSCRCLVMHDAHANLLIAHVCCQGTAFCFAQTPSEHVLSPW